MSAARTLLCIGDPNGVGPEIAVAAARQLATSAQRTPVLVGDRAVVESAVRATGGTEVVRSHNSGELPPPGTMDLIDVAALPGGAHRPGEIDPDAGLATVEYVRAAVEAAASGDYRAVVAAPHSETAIHRAGRDFSGYPSLLADLTGIPRERVFLLLVGAGLRIVHATLHRRLADAIGGLDTDTVAAAGRALYRALADLGAEPGRIGVFGINPHAGESGLFGGDDDRVTAPAVARLRDEGLPVDGPVGADVLLAAHDPAAPTGSHVYAGYVAAYHDQGHIPVKLLAGRRAVALSIGTAVPFCSVGHGAAFDIAGTGSADPGTLLAALRTVDPRPEAAAR